MKIHWPTGSLTFPSVTCSHPDPDLRLQSESLLRVQQLFLKLKVPLTHAHPDSFAKRCKTETTTTRLSLAAGPDAKGLWYFLHLFKPLSPVSLPGCLQSYLGADQWSFNPLVERVGSHRFVCLPATHINTQIFTGMEELLLPNVEEEVRSDNSSYAPGNAEKTMGDQMKTFLLKTVKGDLRTVKNFFKRNGLLTLSVISVITGCTLGFMLRGSQMSTQVLFTLQQTACH